MKRICLFVFLLMPAMAFGQNGSGRLGPFTQPLDFKVTVNGVEETTNNQTGNSSGPLSFPIEWVMNPSDTGYHISGDTISNSLQEGPGLGISKWFTLVFDSINKTISRVNFGFQDNTYYDNYGPEIGSTSESIDLSNFSYDSSSIFTTDSSIAFHQADPNYSNWYDNQGPGNLSDPETSESLTSVSSISLSGSFRLITLVNTSGVAMPIESPSGMSISNKDGFIQCVFPSSDHPRALELYTPLGVKAASTEIPAGESEISLPHLMSGLYFVRIEGNFLKIAVN